MLVMTMPRKPVDVPRMDLQLPDLNFEINPQLAAGMAVAAPPAEAAPAPATLSSDLFSLEEVDQVPAVQKQVKRSSSAAKIAGSGRLVKSTPSASRYSQWVVV